MDPIHFLVAHHLPRANHDREVDHFYATHAFRFGAFAAFRSAFQAIRNRGRAPRRLVRAIENAPLVD